MCCSGAVVVLVLYFPWFFQVQVHPPLAPERGGDQNINKRRNQIHTKQASNLFFLFS